MRQSWVRPYTWSYIVKESANHKKIKNPGLSGRRQRHVVVLATRSAEDSNLTLGELQKPLTESKWGTQTRATVDWRGLGGVIPTYKNDDSGH